MKAKHYASQVADILVPQQPAPQHPRCSHIGIALSQGSDFGVNLGAVLGKKKTGAVPDPTGQPAIQPDGSVQPSRGPGDTRFTANPVNSLNPVLAPVAAPSAVSEWQIRPQAALAPAPRPQGIGGYAPGVTA